MKPTYQLHSISNGAAGIKETLDFMSRITKKYRKAPAIRELAMALTRNLPQKKGRAEVQVIHRFVKNEIRYVKDIRECETLQTPIQTLRLGGGDCDDKSMLAAALLEAIGHRTRFVAVGMQKGRFSHVFPETKIGGKWLSVECTEPVSVGWRPPNIKSSMVVNN